MKSGFILALAPLTLVASPAQSEVTATGENGFAVSHTVRVAVDADQAYVMVRSPSKWWSKEHSWTGDADNLYMDSQAGGCFCELIKGEPDQDDQRPLRGSVQHMRILYADPGKILRLTGALGPVQSEAMTGTLTILFKPVDGGTEVRFDYVLGGYMRFPIDQVAPGVDAVIGEQASRLAMALGPLVGDAKPGEDSITEDDEVQESGQEEAIDPKPEETGEAGF